MSIVSAVAIVSAGSAGLQSAPGGTASIPADLGSAGDASRVGSGEGATAFTADQPADSPEASKWKQILASAGMDLRGQQEQLAGASANAAAGDQESSKAFEACTDAIPAQSAKAMMAQETANLKANISSDESTPATSSSESARHTKTKPKAPADAESSASTSNIPQQAAAALSTAAVAQLPMPALSGASTAGSTIALCKADGDSIAVPASSTDAVFSLQGSGARTAAAALTNAGFSAKPVDVLPSSTSHNTKQFQQTLSAGSLGSASQLAASSAVGSAGAEEVAKTGISSALRQGGSSSMEDARVEPTGAGAPIGITPEKSADMASSGRRGAQERLGVDSPESAAGSVDTSAELQRSASLAGSSAGDAKSQLAARKTDLSTTVQQASPVQESAGSALIRSAYQADAPPQAADGTKGTLSSRSEAALNGSSAFTALDSGNDGPITTWVAANPRTVEAGYHDSSLGWVSVRAQSDAAGVHATVVPVSADAAQSLSTHLSGLSAYLSEQRSPISSVTIDTSGMSMTGQSPGNGAPAQGQQEGGGAGTERSNLFEANISSVSAIPALSDTAIPAVTAGGTYISVLV